MTWKPANVGVCEPGEFKGLYLVTYFADPRQLYPRRLATPPIPPADVVYVGAAEAWKRLAKNWSLARPCLARLGSAGFSVLVVGAPPRYRPPPGVRVVDPLPWHELLAVLARSRLLFVPNRLDPSPQVLAEALCLDVPALVNREAHHRAGRHPPHRRTRPQERRLDV